MDEQANKPESRVRIMRSRPVDQQPPSEPLQEPTAPRSKRVLNTGSGTVSHNIHPMFAQGWEQKRLDLDPGVEPDIVAAIQDMKGAVEDGVFDAIWCSHNLEHVHSFEVVPTLREFRRILRDDGFVLLTCPDLAAVAQFILARGLTATAYESPAGPITPLDMIYGHNASIVRGNRHMQHLTGFTQESLAQAALQAGFSSVRVARGGAFDLWALLLMSEADLLAIGRDLGRTSESFLVGPDPESQ